MLRRNRMGVMVHCATCGLMKKPIGRSPPLGASYCDDECRGYRMVPYPGSLWPGESEAEFGYTVGADGTADAEMSQPGAAPRVTFTVRCNYCGHLPCDCTEQPGAATEEDTRR